MRYFVKFPSGRELPVDLTLLPTGEIRATIEGRVIEADAYDHGGMVHVGFDGKSVELWLEGAPPDVGVIASSQRFYAHVESERMRALSDVHGKKAGGGDNVVKSPMPGRVLKVLVAEGDEVHAGRPLVVVEAMKMENELSAARDGKVKKVFVSPGATVDGGAKLVELE
jgi:biotin carboxyl carrier protein